MEQALYHKNYVCSCRANLRQHAPPLPSIPRPLSFLRPHQRAVHVSVAVAQPGDDSSRSEAAAAPSPLEKLTSLFKPLSDPALNNKLLALAVGQMLCSLATLIHDSYLPVYIQDELGLSNTKIGALQGAAQFLCQLSKGVSGVVGDILGSQVRMLVFGTFITLLCKPMYAMLSSVYGIFGLTACIYWFFTAKLLDRLSKVQFMRNAL
ncbi:hypothetical protein DUNSADRAFT_12622 [Dunaliella salina]|uniref:Major facilitator superfamily (MFS) profile domain-containing protein n=1 Tax=Dunaliella salina TaxID=3046 RepID=A0ABQ7GAX4_DUNSA|nr:hypothetical protein DUNSADRAFT_12622 [Dunaliella salina]|eukprot:KAF5831752.1 hypothetical protein DUNSADRAFT_12622 [Dunaliella salina]